MSEEKYDIETIDRYIKGLMDETELHRFETQMGVDPELTAEVELQKDVMIGAEAFFDDELKGQLQQIDREANKAQSLGKQVFFTPWRATAIAASLLLLFTVGYFLFFTQPNAEQLYLSYYEPYPNIVNPIQRSESNNREDGLSYYENGNYQKAVETFDLELKNAPSTDFLIFYQAISFIELGDYQKTSALLKTLEDKTDSRFYQPANWYLALAHLRAGDSKEAKEQLGEIIDAGGDYQLRAKELLDQL